MRGIRIAVGGLLLALFVPASAGTVVWFVDGRALEVESIEFADGFATARLEGGILMSIPAERIEAVRDGRRPAAPPRAASARRIGDGDWRHSAGRFASIIDQAARRHGVDPSLLAAMAAVESGFNPLAVSHKGAEGLLQLMPETARRFGVADSFDPHQNVEGAARYLKWLLARYDGDRELALAGYNAGEGAVDRHRGIPPFPETEDYVVRVLARLDSLTR